MPETKANETITELQHLIDYESVLVTGKDWDQFFAVPEAAIRRLIEKLKEDRDDVS